MKKNWIVIIIIFLLALNAAFLATIIVQKSKVNKYVDINSMRTEHPHHKNWHKRDKMGFEGQLIRDLEMDEKQVNQLHEIRENYFNNKNNLKHKIKEIRYEINHILINGKGKEANLEELADSLGKLTAEMMVLDFKHYENIKSICRPEQVGKLDSLGRVHIHKFGNKGCGRRHVAPKE